MSYQYRAPARTQAIEALRKAERELERVRARALRAEQQLRDKDRQVLDAELRAREAHNEREAYQDAIDRLTQERDTHRREVDRLTQPPPEPPWYGNPEDLVFQDRLIHRCRCGSWVYAHPLCSYCSARQQQIETLRDEAVA